MIVGVLIEAPPVAQGAINGLTYGMLAVGLILVYRSSRIVNFAHGALGAVAAAAFGSWIVRFGVPYWLVFPAALAIGASSGIVVEVVAVRRLRKAPPAMSIVATLGMAAFLTGLAHAINTQIRTGSTYPQPPHIPTFNVGQLIITPAYSLQLIVTPVVVIALGAFLRWTRYGTAIRATADNREAAVLSGVAPGRMSWIVWGIAGTLSAYAAIMQAPSQGFFSQITLGTGLLLRALLPAVVARMDNLPVALGSGVALGVIEGLLLWNGRAGGEVELLIFVLLFAVLLAYSRQHGSREREQGSWLAVQAWPPLPDEFNRLWAVRNLGHALAGALALALFSGYWLSNQRASTMTNILAFSLIGMSVFITSGLTGQLSLGQFALAGIGAVISYQLVRHGTEFVVAFALAGVGAGLVGALLAFTALRIRGLMLTVTTLALAVVSHTWLFHQSWAFDDGVRPGRPSYGGHVLSTGRGYYLFAVPVFLVGLWVTRNVARSGLGRSFVALRDNEDAARAFAIRATRRKLQSIAIAGFLAGVGGALYAHAQFQVSSTTFPSETGITVVAMAAIGGLSITAGAFFGALYLIGLPAFVHLDAAATATSTLGWLVLVLYFPGGLAQVLRPVRDHAVGFVARLHGARLAMSEEPETATPAPLPRPRLAAEPTTVRPHADDRPVLSVAHLSKHFVGVRALDDVTLHIRRGEILGLIGPNGAGKTTLFESIGGFVAPDSGSVEFAGHDVTRWAPERRAAAGLVRSFQAARLFPTMTVLDVVTLALERQRPSNLLGSSLAWPATTRQDRAKRRLALGVVEQMGLHEYRHVTVSALSTGTRRITELACIVAMGPSVVLLDEPSAGIAQRETEALGELISAMRSALDATIVVIEHDIPLVTTIADRMVAMHLGRVVTVGSPADVCVHPDVVASYLGDDPTAIARSDVVPVRSGSP